MKKQHKQRWSTIPRIYKTSIISYEPTKQFEDTKGVTRIRKSKKDRQHNGQKKKNNKEWTALCTENTEENEDIVNTRRV